jgi:hypothetical protein
MGIRQSVSKHPGVAGAMGFFVFIGLVAVALLTLAPTRDGHGGGGGGGGAKLSNDRIATMETSGDLHEMLQQHQAMMETMRVDSSPSMLARMDADPMWQMLESGELIELMAEHQQNIDRMLAEDVNGN